MLKVVTGRGCIYLGEELARNTFHLFQQVTALHFLFHLFRLFHCSVPFVPWNRLFIYSELVEQMEHVPTHFALRFAKNGDLSPTSYRIPCGF